MLRSAKFSVLLQQNEDGRDSDMEKKSLEEICDAVLPHPIHETNVNNCLNFLTLESQKIMTAANNGGEFSLLLKKSVDFYWRS